MRSIFDWLDHRMDYRCWLAPIRERTLPNGPRWEYATASCLFWMLVVEVVTGLLLMTTYSPSSSTAWASTYYIEKMLGGIFIRGLHYFAGQALIILFALHTVRVLLAAAFRRPYELVWATGLLLIPLVLLWSMSGNPLSFSQKAVGQIEVEGKIIGDTPIVGPPMHRILLGGEEVGHLTLTHLYFLHVALLPLLVGLLAVIHISQVYRHGVASQQVQSSSSDGGVPYWPHQTVRNIAVFSVAFAIVAYLAYTIGAPLEAPAEPGVKAASRPEWYFVFLSELRTHYMTGDWEIVATTVLPLLTLFLLLMMPLMDRMVSPRISKAFRVVVVVGGVAIWTGLTLGSLSRDWEDEDYQESQRIAHVRAERAKQLADLQGIPSQGAVELLRNDPLTQGPILFKQHCASCHDHVDADGKGFKSEKPTAPNLYRFASQKWIAGLLDPKQIADAHYFGNTAHAEGEMVGDVQEKFSELDEEGKENLAKLIVALSAEAKLDYQKESDAAAAEAGTIEAGVEAIGEFSCTDCHKFHDEGELGEGPDLTGYGSREWLSEIIRNPAHERFYPEDANDRMPAFADSSQDAEQHRLSPKQLKLLVDWLREEYVPAGPTEK